MISGDADVRRGPWFARDIDKKRIYPVRVTHILAGAILGVLVAAPGDAAAQTPEITKYKLPLLDRQSEASTRSIRRSLEFAPCGLQRIPDGKKLRCGDYTCWEDIKDGYRYCHKNAR